MWSLPMLTQAEFKMEFQGFHDFSGQHITPGMGPESNKLLFGSKLEPINLGRVKHVMNVLF